jgi:predicted ATPase
VSDGIAQMRTGLDEYRITGGGSIKPSFLSLLAEAYGKIGQFKQALNVLAEAQDLADENGERWWQAELHRIKGELILRDRGGHTSSRDSENEAEDCFRQALGVATAQEAKSLRLRAAMSLCKLWIPQLRHSEAHELLGPAMRTFEEGFDTPDLLDAKHLMEVIMAS